MYFSYNCFLYLCSLLFENFNVSPRIYVFIFLLFFLFLFWVFTHGLLSTINACGYINFLFFFYSMWDLDWSILCCIYEVWCSWWNDEVGFDIKDRFVRQFLLLTDASLWNTDFKQMGSLFIWNGVLSWCVLQILSILFFWWCCEMKFLSITLLVKRFQTALFQLTVFLNLLFLNTTFSNNPTFNNLKNKLYQMG